MGRRRYLAFVLAVVLASDFAAAVSAAYHWSGLPGDPPLPQLPAASPPASIPPPAGTGLALPRRTRFYHDRDVRVIGTVLMVLVGARALLRRPFTRIRT